ncbi:carbonic anhydrase family protein [Paraburkholderia xenovorans LB400]|uniref:carbonic anhydrase n=1 Tax=Paraburkholderia xenovorans (strain LB400) TaxID=266265 RepID=Q13MJ0_PARXL|nr:carbonic anhydrase [Paraburkholderia xenovorans]ABE34699.1 Putative carbonic anhydrase precursor [Paraburkholderia xenovorans LB400]AIP36498.1 carbonic anhydrase family protein [Paraburkholderia xenovorans LB400]
MCDRHLSHLCSPARRNLLLAGASSITLAGLSRHDAMAAEPAAANAPNSIPPAEALGRLMQGNARYAANTSLNKDYSAGRAARVSAQYPIAAIVGCADSRVAPELAFDQGPGDLFVVRVAGNFVNDDILASLEYGVEFLGVPLIMVLGHTQCGAVSATVKVLHDSVRLPGHLPELVRAIEPAVRMANAEHGADLAAQATIDNVRLNTNRLTVSKPLIGQYVKSGKVKVVGGIYDLATGRIALI